MTPTKSSLATVIADSNRDISEIKFSSALPFDFDFCNSPSCPMSESLRRLRPRKLMNNYLSKRGKSAFTLDVLLFPFLPAVVGAATTSHQATFMNDSPLKCNS